MNKIDRNGNYIGDGKSHCEYKVLNIEGVESEVSFSDSTESVYVTYRANNKSCVCRFSHHTCNGVKFGDYLNGFCADEYSIKTKLGFYRVHFEPEFETKLTIESDFFNNKIAKKMIENGTVEAAAISIQDLYKRGAGADVTDVKGKMVGRYLIKGNRIETKEIPTGYGWDVYTENGKEIKRVHCLAPREFF